MKKWYGLTTLSSKNYVCGHCGNDISSNEGYYMYESTSTSKDIGSGYIYICHKCNKPTYINTHEQVPGAIYGECFSKEIFNDELVFQLYEETRRCMEISAYTSVGMCCRKLLMHIAVDCGAEKNKKFIEYVNYLDDNNYIPTNCKEWVDIIRNKGNEANHEITILDENDAKQLISFIEMIISVIYKMPYQAKTYIGAKDE